MTEVLCLKTFKTGLTFPNSKPQSIQSEIKNKVLIYHWHFRLIIQMTALYANCIGYYTHTYVNTCMHACVRTYIHSYIQIWPDMTCHSMT